MKIWDVELVMYLINSYLSETHMKKQVALTILVLLMVGLLTSTGNFLGEAEAKSLTKATFYVHWYEVGKSALDGLKGVEKVSSGWEGAKETNTVIYDPDSVTLKEMEKALKQARTYRGTAKN